MIFADINIHSITPTAPYDLTHLFILNSTTKYHFPASNNINKITKTNKVRSDGSKTGSVVLKETVIKSLNQWNQVENCIHKEERDQKYVSPLRVADTTLLFCHSITSYPTF